MWHKLWNEAFDSWQRDDLFHDTINLWGTQLIQKLSEVPAIPLVEAEVECLRFVFIRHPWVIQLKWQDIDRWIQRHFPQAKFLPDNWTLTALMKEAMREKLGLALGGGE